MRSRTTLSRWSTKELQLPRRFVVTGGVQIRFFAQRRPGDRKRVDRIGLAAGAGALAGACHQLRRHAQDALAGGQQEALQAAVYVATVLESEAQLLSALQPVGPGEEPPVALLVGRNRDFAEQLPDVVDGDGRVGPLVRVDADRDHSARLLMLGVVLGHGSTADRTGWGSRTLLSGHAIGPRTRRATGPVGQPYGRHRMSGQPVAPRTLSRLMDDSWRGALGTQFVVCRAAGVVVVGRFSEGRARPMRRSLTTCG